MPYNLFNELTLFYDDEAAARKIYDVVKEKYPNKNAEELMKNNIEYAKRNTPKDGDLVRFIQDAIENDYAGSVGADNTNSYNGITVACDVADKTIIDELRNIFVDEERANEIYDSIKGQYASVNPDELIRANIEFAQKKEKKLGRTFLRYLEDVILKNSAGYTEVPANSKSALNVSLTAG